MTTGSPLAGRRVGITADRRWRAQADLLEKLGAEVIHGPTLRTVDLSRSAALRRATEDLIGRPPDFVVASTGMGMTMWFDAAESWGLAEPLRAALAGSTIIARGAKATSALRRHGFEVAWAAPNETMEEVTDQLSARGVGTARVALQLFDPGGHPSTVSLAARCGEVVEVPVYRWLLPEDPTPALRLLEETCAGSVDALTFTSQPAVRHLFRIAEGVGAAEQLRAVCNTTVLPVCVGPVCAESATAAGLTRPLWPDPPRLAAMVRLVATRLGVGSDGDRPSARLPRGNQDKEDRADG
jgi:uroporphyrinogen-III synthase